MALQVPAQTAKDWRLRIHGMVDKEITLSFEDLLRRPLVERTLTLTCVSNPVGGNLISTANFIGVELRPILIEALPAEHGFPVRMIVPGLYGYVSGTKWIADMDVTTFAAQQGYWLQRGWSQEAPIKTECRIDRPQGFASKAAGKLTCRVARMKLLREAPHVGAAARKHADTGDAARALRGGVVEARPVHLPRPATVPADGGIGDPEQVPAIREPRTNFARCG